MNPNFLKARLQLLLIQTALKEYEADWLKGENRKVVRDSSGRFASKGSTANTSNNYTYDPTDSFREFVGRDILAKIEDFFDNIFAKIPGLKNKLEFKPPNDNDLLKIVNDPKVKESLQALELDPEQVSDSLIRLNTDYAYDVNSELEKSRSDRKAAYKKYQQNDNEENYKSLAEAESRLAKLEMIQNFYKSENPARRYARRIQEIADLYQDLKPQDNEVNKIQEILLNSDLSEDERQRMIERKSDLLKIEWRKNVIDAEVKYGRQISEIVINAASDMQAEENYQKFIQSLKNNRTPDQNNPSFRKTRIKSNLMLALYDLASGGNVNLNDPTVKEVTNTLTSLVNQKAEYLEKTYKDIATSAIAELNDIIPTPLNLDLEFRLDQPNVAQVDPFTQGMYINFPGTNAKIGDAHEMGKIMHEIEDEPALLGYFHDIKDKDGAVDLNDFNPEAFIRLRGLNKEQITKTASWHETAHILEIRNGAVEKSAIFREERHLGSETKTGSANMLNSAKIKVINMTREAGNLLVYKQKFQLDETYDDYQTVVKDAHTLAGKSSQQSPLLRNTKNGDMLTEVVSIGIESLSNYRLLQKHANVDRESFMYALSVSQQK